MCVICFEAIENGPAECVYVHQDNIMMRNQGLRGARQEKHKEQRRTDGGGWLAGGLYSPYLSLSVCVHVRKGLKVFSHQATAGRSGWMLVGGALSYMWNFLNELNIDKQDCSTVLGSISQSTALAHQTKLLENKRK